jgi:hypothetical protein
MKGFTNSTFFQRCFFAFAIRRFNLRKMVAVNSFSKNLLFVILILLLALSAIAVILYVSEKKEQEIENRIHRS